jgi:peptidoglycan/LPS O-acetylase OafA/YrhL
VAILLVLFSHGHFLGDDLLPLQALKGRSGFLGVQVFFVLSGFLITTLMLREIRRSGRVHLGGFYLRRALRILPAYVLYLAILAVLEVCGVFRFTGRHWLAAATYTVNFLPPSVPIPMSHIWSLCVEEHFYILWPLLMVLLPSGWRFRAIPICMVAALVLRWLLLASPSAPVDLLTLTRIDDIAVGCGLAFLARESTWRSRLDRFASPGWLLPLLAVFAATQVCFSRTIGTVLLHPIVLRMGLALTNDISSLTIAVLMWAVVTRPASLCGCILNSRPAVGLGVCSYSVYLWHVLPCANAGPAWLCGFPQNLVFVFLAATLSYRLLERPFLAWKDRLGGTIPSYVPLPAPGKVSGVPVADLKRRMVSSTHCAPGR